ncbi:tol-like protein [Colletotrichum musicola]|uniref:Tol-like protein n=1 Tax=Colletotrichum musicola TaxID=2175873 RepID=A0A8H6MNH8_9PEZI|nr:tol-like protein [Colletotrichum musicola]
MGSLRRRLKEAMILENPEEPNSSFLPYSDLQKLLSEKEVSEILLRRKHKLRHKVSDLTSFICARGGARRTFAALVYEELVGSVDDFYDNNFTDDMLPVVIGSDYLVHSTNSDPSRSSGLANIFGNDDYWTESKVESFCHSTQWCFLAPVFDETKFKYSFLRSTRMPFIPIGEVKRDSNFSTVERCLIHRAHLRHISRNAEGHPLVAIKELKNLLGKSNTEFGQAAQSEANVLVRMRGLNHPHLIKAIAYYTRGLSHVIMFPWAGGGNLRDYWKKDLPRKLDAEFISWAFGQFCGLASAIEELHSSTKDTDTCRHGDLKPENILCFENKDAHGSLTQPSLVIADVGLAKVHDLATDMRNEATRTVAGTVTYEPPEAILWKHKPRSRRYDIWSMGCIYFEFLIWMLYGKNELDHFGEEITSKNDGTGRKFFEIVAGEARIKPSVQKWIEHIRADRRCPENTAVRQLLELIATRLLVVNLGRRSTLISQSNSMATTYQDGTPNIQVLVRQPTIDINLQDPTDLHIRAAADEMFRRLENVTRDTLDTRSQLQWMNFQAPSSGGPTQQYPNRLAPSQGRRGH